MKVKQASDQSLPKQTETPTREPGRPAVAVKTLADLAKLATEPYRVLVPTGEGDDKVEVTLRPLSFSQVKEATNLLHQADPPVDEKGTALPDDPTHQAAVQAGVQRYEAVLMSLAMGEPIEDIEQRVKVWGSVPKPQRDFLFDQMYRRSLSTIQDEGQAALFT